MNCLRHATEKDAEGHIQSAPDLTKNQGVRSEKNGLAHGFGGDLFLTILFGVAKKNTYLSTQQMFISFFFRISNFQIQVFFQQKPEKKVSFTPTPTILSQFSARFGLRLGRLCGPMLCHVVCLHPNAHGVAQQHDHPGRAIWNSSVPAPNGPPFAGKKEEDM